MLLTRWGADLLPMNWRWNPHENIILSNLHAVEVQNNSECAYGLQNSVLRTDAVANNEAKENQ